MNRYDLAVIGGGPGGYVGAIRAAQLGLKVCIIEREKLGGVCLNWGCIPTKALIKNAEVYRLIKQSEKYGINVQNITVDFKKNVKRSRDTSKRLSKGIEFLMKKNKIKHLNGFGRFTSENNIEINNNDKVSTVEADKIIIATGAKPKAFPDLSFDSENVISSKEAMLLENPPKDLVIIGSGAIGVEFAYYFNEFGTRVHIVEMMDRILPNEDHEISEEVEKNFKKSGIKITKGVKVSKIQSMKQNAKVCLEKKANDEIIKAEKVLLAVGVTGNINNIGLEDLGIETEAGAIKTDNFNVHYHEEIEKIALSSANIAEQVLPTLLKQVQLSEMPIIDIILTSEDENMNGFATFTNTTFIWVDQNDASIWLENQKWLEQVISHELQHIVYFNKVKTWLPEPYSLGIGNTPSWFVEGIAEYYTENWRIYYWFSVCL